MKPAQPASVLVGQEQDAGQLQRKPGFIFQWVNGLEGMNIPVAQV
ncbi:hypothetical protein [Leptolyngbya sp. FACHB-261]|nr:hypothetical protein [Leptolyngbya sp. FACHB-261]